MKREIDAYRQIHPDLVKTHLDKYVAIFQGQVVDHDKDPVALHKRVKANYPDEIVLSRRVTTQLERVINMRSPCLERIS